MSQNNREDDSGWFFCQVVVCCKCEFNYRIVMIKKLYPGLYLDISFIGTVVYYYFKLNILNINNSWDAKLQTGFLWFSSICLLIYFYKSRKFIGPLYVSDKEYRYWNILIDGYLLCLILLVVLQKNCMLAQHIILYSMTVILTCILIMQIYLIKSGKYYFKKK